jgi:hypothetical protein
VTGRATPMVETNQHQRDELRTIQAQHTSAQREGAKQRCYDGFLQITGKNRFMWSSISEDLRSNRVTAMIVSVATVKRMGKVLRCIDVGRGGL